MDTRSNEAWLRALRTDGRDRYDALEELRDYLLRAVLVYLRGRRHDLDDWTQEHARQFAEDVVQDALLAIDANLERFRGEAKFTTWAYRFAINAAASELRRLRYRDFSLEALEATTLLRVYVREPQPARPETIAGRRAMLALLGEIIERELTERQRVAVLAVYVEGHSIAVVAEEMETSRNALYKLLHDARQKLKAALEAEHISAGDILGYFET
jgi:RNA polymerase sigma-70 factor (ECF subfamily)